MPAMTATNAKLCSSHHQQYLHTLPHHHRSALVVVARSPLSLHASLLGLEPKHGLAGGGVGSRPKSLMCVRSLALPFLKSGSDLRVQAELRCIYFGLV